MSDRRSVGPKGRCRNPPLDRSRDLHQKLPGIRQKSLHCCLRSDLAAGRWSDLALDRLADLRLDLLLQEW